MRGSISSIALLSLCISPAWAADLPSRAPPPVFVPPPLPLTWTGCYGGVFGGYDIARVSTSHDETANSTVSTTTTTTTTTTAPSTTILVPATGVAAVRLPPRTVVVPGATTTTTNTTTTRATATTPLNSSYGRTDSGGDGGGRLGCNYQTGRVVIGGQVEGGYLGISGTATDPLRTTSFSSMSGGVYGALTARLGYALGERTLLYVRGGVGYADLRYTAADYTLGYTTSTRGSQVMPLVGAGLEYKLSSNWSLTGEYTYLRPGCRTSSYNYTSPTSTVANGASVTTINTTGSGTSASCVDKHMIAVGLNYYFNSAVAPIVARY